MQCNKTACRADWLLILHHGLLFDYARSVGRILNREVLNLGFSGNCRMQAEVAALLVELKPSAFVVDCLPNMDATTVAQRAVYASGQVSVISYCLALSTHFNVFPTDATRLMLTHCRCAAVLLQTTLPAASQGTRSTCAYCCPRRPHLQ